MSQDAPIRLAVIGAGLVGQRHVDKARPHPDFELAVIVDPDPARQELAERCGCRYAATVEGVPQDTCSAAIIATPNADHLPSGLACLERNWACLIEKPVADTLENGETLVTAFEARGLPLLIGHHRRYHPFADMAKALINDGTLGQPVCASLIWAVRKPDSYFKSASWRTGSDGGPLLINFIHEADLMIALFGPVRDVQAMVSSHARSTQVEDSAAILIRFASGVLATVILTDAALSPWSFEGASGENPTIAETGIAPWRVKCTAGSFEFPGLRIWKDAQGAQGDWSRPLKSETLKAAKVDPLHEQLTHFARLIRGQEDCAKVSGRDGLEALRLVEAVHMAARSGQTVSLAGGPFNEKAI